MILEIIVAVLSPIVLLFLIEYCKHCLKLKQFPPGPFPLPVIGNLHYLTNKPFEDFRLLSEKYGDPFSISLGMQRVVVIGSIKNAREALITKAVDFAGRPSDHYTGSLISKGLKDIAFSDYGPTWRLLRKVGHASLKMYGEGMNKLEGLVVKECEEMHARINQSNCSDPYYEYGKNLLY